MRIGFLSQSSNVADRRTKIEWRDGMLVPKVLQRWDWKQPRWHEELRAHYITSLMSASSLLRLFNHTSSFATDRCAKISFLWIFLPTHRSAFCYCLKIESIIKHNMFTGPISQPSLATTCMAVAAVTSSLALVKQSCVFAHRLRQKKMRSTRLTAGGKTRSN